MEVKTGSENAGWTVKRMGEGVLIAKVDREYIVTGWPVEPFGSNALPACCPPYAGVLGGALAP